MSFVQFDGQKRLLNISQKVIAYTVMIFTFAFAFIILINVGIKFLLGKQNLNGIKVCCQTESVPPVMTRNLCNYHV